ncbi:hypothetical protein PUR22_07610 [Mycolicibacterium porcinum]|uniref:hypothetical protein n=1 Tax=Mycolicibacterium porcinum TaxID=39693 RepID=UPI0031F8D43B
MEAQNVCGTHGGRAPLAKAKARRRIDEAADRMAARLLGIAESENMPAYVSLQAVLAALDRAGIKPPTQVDIGIKSPWEEVMGEITGIAQITRAESEARDGIAPAPAALAGPHDAEPLEVVDAEVVDDPAPHPGYPRTGRTPGDRRDGPPNRPAFATGDVGRPPGKSLMTAEDAVAGQRAYISSQRIKKTR